MKWFKHMSDMHDNERVCQYMYSCKNPLEAYGFYIMMLELVASKVQGNKCSVKYPLKVWYRMFNIHHNKFTTLLEKLRVGGLVQAQYDDSKGGSSLIVTIPKLLKIRDEYSKKSGQCTPLEEEEEEEEDNIKIFSNENIKNSSVDESTHTPKKPPDESKPKRELKPPINPKYNCRDYESWHEVYEMFVSDWNKHASSHGLSSVTVMNDKRKKAIRTLYGGEMQGQSERFEKAVESLVKDDFALGLTGDGGWKASFDYILTAKGFIKYFEAN